MVQVFFIGKQKEVIIWNSEETGHISITIVAQGCPMTDEEIIAKDVPTKNFRVIKRTEIDKLDQRFVPNAFINLRYGSNMAKANDIDFAEMDIDEIDELEKKLEKLQKGD